MELAILLITVGLICTGLSGLAVSVQVRRLRRNVDQIFGFLALDEKKEEAP